jgi:uncharacterized delta-60 repeat protein
MGSSYYAARGLWWYGTSAIGPSTYQDDISVIGSATNGFGYRADDNLAAAPLAVAGREVSGAGLIEKTTDQDSFTFTAAAGEVNLSVNVPASVGNLNARLELRDAAGNLLAASDPANFDTRRTVTYQAAAGSYVLIVGSHGSYGDVGQYTLSGTIAVPSTIATPTNLIAAASSTSQIDLSWLDNANNEDSFLLERSSDSGRTWTPRATLPADSTSFSDSATAGTTYSYRVSARNLADVSAYSNQVKLTTLPDIPASLIAAALFSDRIYLAWSNVAGETGYKIERSADGGGTWSQIAATGADLTSFQDGAGLLPATSYQYRLAATNVSGDSGYSNTAIAATLPPPPTAFGSGDGSYILESWSGIYNDLKVQPTDQKIVAAGSKYSADAANPSDHRMLVARYAASGSDDTSFGTGGFSAPNLGSSIEYGNALVLQSDGKAVVAGLENSSHAVARFNTNGTLDTSFGTGGFRTIDVSSNDFYAPATAVGLQSTGKIVIAGNSLNTNTTVDPAVLARLTASGALDSGKNAFGTLVKNNAPGYVLGTFGGNNNGFNDLVVQSDNKIVVVGASVNDATGGLLVVRYAVNGTLDNTFNGNGRNVFLPAGLSMARASAVALQADGKIVVAGFCTGIDGSNDMLVARFNTNGTIDATFGGGTGYVRLDTDGAPASTESGQELLIQPNGKIVVAGNVTAPGSFARILVARFNTNGTPDTTFGPAGFKIGSLGSEMGSRTLITSGVGLMADGSIVVGGAGVFAPPGTSDLPYYHPLLMRFSPTSTAAPSGAQAAGSLAGGSTSRAAVVDAALNLLLLGDPIVAGKKK